MLFNFSRKGKISSIILLAHFADCWSVCPSGSWPSRQCSPFCFSFPSMICYWIKQQSPGRMIWNPNSALGPCRVEDLSGSLLPPALHLLLLNWVFLALAHHAGGRGQHIRGGKLLPWPDTAPGCLEFEYQDTAKWEINSSLEWVRNRFKTTQEWLNESVQAVWVGV